MLRVMFDTRVTLQQQVSAQIETHFGDKDFQTIVPRNVRLAEAPSYGMPGTVYDKNSRGAKAYIEFGNELVKGVKKEALLAKARIPDTGNRPEEHTSELQSLMRISYAGFCLHKKNIQN